MATWLNSTEYTIKTKRLQAFEDLEVYPNPSIITDNEQRPDFAIVKCDYLLISELNVGFKTNIKKSFDRKVSSYLLSYQISAKFIM